MIALPRPIPRPRPLAFYADAPGYVSASWLLKPLARRCVTWGYMPERCLP